MTRLLLHPMEVALNQLNSTASVRIHGSGRRACTGFNEHVSGTQAAPCQATARVGPDCGSLAGKKHRAQTSGSTAPVLPLAGHRPAAPHNLAALGQPLALGPGASGDQGQAAGAPRPGGPKAQGCPQGRGAAGLRVARAGGAAVAGPRGGIPARQGRRRPEGSGPPRQLLSDPHPRAPAAPETPPHAAAGVPARPAPRPLPGPPPPARPRPGPTSARRAAFSSARERLSRHPVRTRAEAPPPPSTRARGPAPAGHALLAAHPERPWAPAGLWACALRRGSGRSRSRPPRPARNAGWGVKGVSRKARGGLRGPAESRAGCSGRDLGAGRAGGARSSGSRDAGRGGRQARGERQGPRWGRARGEAGQT
ncbi:translation initiation factor IF-2-like [Choloepus didactylus]|uniref:translation initiation factor IF-2-like n=1 Tax=Choloepus didactylus TaxID=27675 RepID=UPI0018A015AA|nr:translation initiation factor IF-2-like [Choloepus didactylus]